eukprot:gene5545-biopygen5755
MRRRRRRYGREHGQRHVENQTTWIHGPRVTMWRTRPHGFMESRVESPSTWLHQKYPPDFSNFAWCADFLCAAPAAPDSGYFPMHAHVLVRSGACGAVFFPSCA